MEPVTSRHIPVEVTSEVYPHPVWRDLGLTDWEYQRLVAALGREPNWTELGMFSALWSEHCAYKHSRPLFSPLSDGRGADSCKGPARTPASSISATVGPSPSRSNRTITPPAVDPLPRGRHRRRRHLAGYLRDGRRPSRC